MSSINGDLMSCLVKLANFARIQLDSTKNLERTLEIVAECIGHDRIFIISAFELSNIEYKAILDDRPSVGDVNSHTDLWTDDCGNEIGSVHGEGWKISKLGDDIISYYKETANTKFGRIETSGIWNSSAIWNKKWQSLFATGVSGDVAGMIGVRQIFQELPRQHYRAFVLLIPIEKIDEYLQVTIRNGYINSYDELEIK